MNIIKCGACPKLYDGTLSFHENDNFVLSLRCVLKSMGDTVDAGEITSIFAIFSDSRGVVIHTFEETPDENGAVELVFDADVSEKFRKGRYEYDVAVVTGTMRETVAARLPCAVI